MDTIAHASHTTATQDDRRIEVGDLVRSFDFADGDNGYDLAGKRASYIVGRVEAIGDHSHGFGFHRSYAIRVFVQIAAGRSHDVMIGSTVHPPVNGTPASTGGVTLGVVKL